MTGTVTSAEDNEPVIGASIMVKGTTQGVTTNIDGKYSIKVNDNAVLTFSYVGMNPVTVNVGTKSVVNVTMQSSSQTLDEVVVTAMGVKAERKNELCCAESECGRSNCGTVC
ncbi:MAG: carboxypeptidase-like regulatory domain-containing protein [Barnesiella sp.]